MATLLIDICCLDKLDHSDLDDRALDALKEFPADGALAVLSQFLESNLEHVSNKSAYLCGVMKTYRQKSRSGGSLDAKSSSTINGAVSGSSIGSQAKGPDEAKIKDILERTGYTLDVTTGQRKFGGPPPGWEGEPPSNGCEVSNSFCLQLHVQTLMDSYTASKKFNIANVCNRFFVAKYLAIYTRVISFRYLKNVVKYGTFAS